MTKFTIEPFEDGYIVTSRTAGNPCAFFPTLAEARTATTTEENTMQAHALSFIKAPLGYIFNFLAHFDCISGRFVCWGCETFCISDGIQDDSWF